MAGWHPDQDRQSAAAEDRLMLPPKIPKKPKRDTRWRSPAHCNFVRSHACAMCGSATAIEAHHVRLGSHSGLSQKPDDFRCVSLCGGAGGCHDREHHGAQTFWGSYAQAHSQTVEELIAAYIAASPKRREIEQVQRERAA